MATFKEFRVLQLTNPPAPGDNPPENTVYQWYATSEFGDLIIHCRFPDGTNKVVSGAPGPIGATGATGPEGATGPSGGPTGATGSTGADGAFGSTGATGIRGASGVGATGIDGASGASGATGPSGGPVGATGATGPVGSSGATGPSGGPTGATGASGINGASGIAGATGAGISGASGPAGVNGASGVNGQIGASGVSIVGATGPNGASGPSGGLMGQNVIINGSFDFFQRNNNTGVNWISINDDSYCLDRWVALCQISPVSCLRYNDATGTSSVPGPFQGMMSNPSASAQRLGFLQIVEAANSYPLRGQQITLQAGMNSYSPSSTSYWAHYAILEWVGVGDTVTSDIVRDWSSGIYTPNNFFLGSNLNVLAVGDIYLQSVLTQVTLSATVGLACNNLMVFFWSDAISQNTQLKICNVDCHMGGARPFSPRPLAEELTLCQRYFEKSYDLDVKPGTAGAQNSAGAACSSTAWDIYYLAAPMVYYKTTKRVNIVPTIYSVGNANVTGVLTEFRRDSQYSADVLYFLYGYGMSSFNVGANASLKQPTWNATDYHYSWHWTADAEL